MHEILIYNQTKARIPRKFIKSVISKSLAFLKVKQPAELAVLIVGSGEIKRLNKVWRHKNEAADELSFGLNSRPTAGLPAGRQGFAREKPDMLNLGLIVLNGSKISEIKYLTELLVHSLLHLLGHHHEKSAVQAKKMESLEKRILNQLKLKKL